MDKMLIVVFDSERQAYEGTRVLKELHDDGTITLYGESRDHIYERSSTDGE